MLSRITKSGQLDSAAIALSALCMVHCAAGIWLVAGFASLGGILLAPWVHEIGFALAAIMAALALGHGVRSHGARLPLAIGVVGIASMLMAMTVPHGSAYEYALTLAGVAALSVAHLLNYRAARHN
ncbi:MAG: MerC domain-containing protein [Blastomonas fulva]|uniref:MerC domain-containing protein n=1 Tax=Blastomonas fulva TaxID=1550728 RepID=UPI0040331917